LLLTLLIYYHGTIRKTNLATPLVVWCVGRSPKTSSSKRTLHLAWLRMRYRNHLPEGRSADYQYARLYS
jgi:hypothetical protein